MYKVKIALFNAQKSLENNGVEILSQKIAGINFATGSTQNDYQKSELARVLTPEENQKIAWRDDLWDNLSEEYVVISSKRAFAVLIEETLMAIENGKQREVTNKLIPIESKQLENNDEHTWSIISADDRKYAIVNEADIQRPVFQVIKGGKK